MAFDPIYTFQKLKSIHRERRENFEEDFTIRIHRALSWLQRAEKESEPVDDDAKFIFLWISFNAAYANPLSESINIRERKKFLKFFTTALRLNENDIYNYIWKRFSNEIKGILGNEFISSDFWWSLETGDNLNLQKALTKSQESVNEAIPNKKNTIKILKELFDRLYVLRNQLMHGGATWNGKVNRHQVKDCTRLLESLVPIFIKIMMDNPEADWGPIAFPVIK